MKRYKKFCGLISIGCAVLLWGPFTSLHAQQQNGTISEGAVKITEIMYEPIVGGDWVEILNISDSSVTITDLKVHIGTAGGIAIVVDGSTQSALGAGKTAIIAKNATGFKSAYSGYDGPLYSSSGVELPAADNIKVALKQSTTEIDAVTYYRDGLAESTGASLHITLGDVRVPAPRYQRQLWVGMRWTGLYASV